MKRIISVLLAVICVISLSACGAKEAEPITFDGFLKKYKRADLGQVLKDPAQFINDYRSVNWIKANGNEVDDFFSSWTKDETFTIGEHYKREVIILGLPAILNGNKGDNYCSFYITFESPNTDDNFMLAKKICEYYMRLEDPSEIKIDGENASEAKLQSVLISGDCVEFMAAFNLKAVWFNNKWETSSTTIIDDEKR